MKSAQDHVLDYLRTNANSWVMSAELQRMIWKNKRGTTASPRSIVRRLEELENESLIAVGYDGVNAKYRYIEESWRSKYKRASERAHKYSNDYWKTETRAISRQERESARANQLREMGAIAV